MNTQIEEWKAIAECNGEYYVSNYGRVKSLKRGKEIILKDSCFGVGYRGVKLHFKGGIRKSRTIHKLVAVAFISNEENKKEVNHIDGNKLNNNFTNLEWVTRSENAQHGWRTGLFEPNRLSHSKAVIDIKTNKKYVSLKSACEDTSENYRANKSRIFFKLKTQRFFYI
jgi:hypothetical protein